MMNCICDYFLKNGINAFDRNEINLIKFGESIINSVLDFYSFVHDKIFYLSCHTILIMHVHFEMKTLMAYSSSNVEYADNYKKKNVRLLHSFITLINSIEFYVKKDTVRT